MNSTNDPSSTTPVPLDPHTARLVAAFKDALVRMRDGEELTAEDLNVTNELVRLVQATTEPSLAATVMPWFREVFQGHQGGSALHPVTEL